MKFARSKKNIHNKYIFHDFNPLKELNALLNLNWAPWLNVRPMFEVFKTQIPGIIFALKSFKRQEERKMIANTQ